ncbi:MAG: protein ndvB [Steroidobacteraceae bacterium]|nr:protein ndvB [Steroidobacteraceae bacterium]
MAQGGARAAGRRDELMPSILRRLIDSGGTSAFESTEVIRAEIFSAERLEQHAESLAAAQDVTASPVTVRSLTARLRDNRRALLDAHLAVARSITQGGAITPAAEWLVDNYHVVEAQIRQIGDDLPPGYYRQLPKLADGPLAGYPRVLGLVWAFVAHTDSRFDAHLLTRFVRAYQRVQPLTIGELWAIAITLRIVLVENLRRAAEQIASRRAIRQGADQLADRLLGGVGRKPESTAAVLQEWYGASLSTTFAVQLLQRLRDQDPAVTPALAWLEGRLSAAGTTADSVVRDEHQRQGASSITVRNVITSMRSISAIDWADLFESVSLVDATLREHTGFGQMDFPTRDRYRQAIEELARGSQYTELEIARRTMQAASGGATPRERDPGYRLIAGGRRAFETAVGYRATMREWPARVGVAVGIRGYIAGVVLLAAVFLAWPLFALAKAGSGAWMLGALAVCGFVLAVDAAMALANASITSRFGAKILPALELPDGVPAHLRTLVVVPTILATREMLSEHLERLEIHHLASLDGDLCFALLSDWADADAERVPGDEALLTDAVAGIARLNQQYGPAPAGERFLLLHRRRLWNPAQGVWMGWERKRGKLHELNRLLRGATETSFMAVGSTQPAVPAGVRYVVTLDADTRLPRDAVRRLVGKMAHPLNVPRFDERSGRVVEGYAVLQPRIASALPLGREGSGYQRLVSGAGGIDPYASAVSDVYQDLCGEGSYVGKGIYDVDAFEAALAERVPENTLLSHDLFEGIFARAGLASDIEFVDEYPARYDVAAARAHRWARGDWQLLPWVLGRGASGVERYRGAIPLLGRWKMVDNLRRTLLAPASVLTLVAGWTLPPRSAAIWTAFVLAMLAIPTLLPVLAWLVPRRSGISWRSHFQVLLADLRLALAQTGVFLALLAHQAWSMSDAIARTLFRLLVSRRCLLEWVTAAQAHLSERLDRAGFYRLMAGAVAIGVAVIALGIVGYVNLALAVPFGLLWILSPVLARRLSRPSRAARSAPLEDVDVRALRLIARRAWRYFETFVTAADHMLPPDNFQEQPRAVLAHRTSPTNLGLYLLSIVTARDFGWAGAFDTVGRLEATLAEMDRLERFRGHFYNWYDTQDLRPLEPRYVSSVDSGNLAAHLITLANACDEIGLREELNPQLFAGIEDGLALLRESRSGPADERLDEALDQLTGQLSERPATPAELARYLEALATQAAAVVARTATLAHERADEAGAEAAAWAESTLRTIESHRRDLASARQGGAEALVQRLESLATMARNMAAAMRFDFLFDPERKLLSIGFRIQEGNLDPNCYDLLASEARLASFVAIASGELPARHWFRLGRAVTPIHRGAALVSWSGSMFEYLMPSLVMRAAAGSLLDETSRLIVRRQAAYGRSQNVPWGISESAYNARDLEHTYQYSSFGVPGLGLKRGLGDDLVVAPYATALAAMVEPQAATANFARLVAIAAQGRYGFYEALDYTPRRLRAGQAFAIVYAFMAHHQGMTVVALANALLDGLMRRRFHAEPRIQATELLLQERTPRDVAVALVLTAESGRREERDDLAAVLPRSLATPHHATPRTHLLSNGRHSVMLTAAGSGYSSWGDLSVTRWRPDVTCDDWGSYVFLRDVDSGATWSAGYQPCGIEPDEYEVTFSEARAEFIRRDGDVTTTLDVVVSAESDAEVRRVCLSNTGDRVRTLELTSYAELVLAPPAADEAHPAFSKLFVQTEFVADIGVILATRRRRSPEEPEVWAAHLAVVEGDSAGELQFETDRARFVGRGRQIRTAIAAVDDHPLSGTAGTVLDPIFSLRRRIRLAPGGVARVAFWTLVAPTRSEALDLADQHCDAAAFDRAATLAWTQGQVELHHLGITRDEAMLFQRLAGHVLYSDPALRPSSDVLNRGRGGQPALWPHGISGDLPIVLVRIDDTDDLGIVRQLLRAFEYWRLKRLTVDVVILNERVSSYVQDLQVALETLARTGLSRPRIHGDAARGGVYILRSDIISREARLVLLSAARAVVLSRRGSLAEQLDRLEPSGTPLLPPAAVVHTAGASSDAMPDVPALEFSNGLGGFADDGEAYVTILRDGRCTPAPWINVVANPGFGFQVSADGSGCTWAGNSRENRLTPWSNDPVGDRPGEIFYLRDDDTGALWAPTALPIRYATGAYVARHGRGYSRFEHSRHGIEVELLQFVPLDTAVKVARLRIRNVSRRTRHLTVTAYVEWVLGTSRTTTAASVATELDPVTGGMFARNLWSDPGAGVAFLDLGGRQSSWTGDRREFIGRNGTLERPAALAGRATLSGNTGAGFDPCGVLQTALVLAPNATVDVVCLLGEAANSLDAQAMIERWRDADLDATLQSVRDEWDDVLGAVAVQTPDRAFDIMMNGWLLYQTLACRLWARSAFYQASGAYGFRDQLQDTMALILARPGLAREHLLRAAGRQFVEGDVQHWWLPRNGRGVRTRVTDDRVWLGYCAAHYVETTGDLTLLDEIVPFLDGPPLRDGETDSFFEPARADACGTLFEHCARALDQSLAVGAHGLPLMGSGDWNDGMNRVGADGRGESTWLGWFLHLALSTFAPLADARGEFPRGAAWRARAADLRASLELNGWDGQWYRRGFFDDGTPLGSAANDECRIDSIAQSWSVLSGAADPERAARAMAAVDSNLVRRDAGLVALLTPPFDRSVPDPGYIRAYPPGIRENGGQYTHAAAWSVIAFAQLGDGDKAAEVFSILNPINRTRTLDDVLRYKVEPYVVAADVYSQPPHVGRGGWTWYTGSAAWMYRAGLEWMLGCRVRGATLLLDPCIPRSWPGFQVTLQFRGTRYEIAVENPRGANRRLSSLRLDDATLPAEQGLVPLVDDGATHRVHAVLG